MSSKTVDMKEVLSNKYEELASCQDMDALRKTLKVLGNSIAVAPFLKTPSQVVKYMEELGKIVAGDQYKILIGACYSEVKASEFARTVGLSKFQESEIPSDLS